MTDLFIEHIEEVRPIAYKLSDAYNGRFQVDELINIAYMGFHRAITNNPRVFDTGWHRLLSRAKFDMLDYIRKETGSRKVEVDKRCDVDKRVQLPSTYRFSYQRDSDNENGTFFDPPCQKNCFKEFENDDFLDGLLSKVRLTNDEWTIIQSYFEEENTAVKVAEELGYSEATISNKKRKMLKRLNKAAEEMLV